MTAPASGDSEPSATVPVICTPADWVDGETAALLGAVTRIRQTSRLSEQTMKRRVIRTSSLERGRSEILHGARIRKSSLLISTDVWGIQLRALPRQAAVNRGKRPAVEGGDRGAHAIGRCHTGQVDHFGHRDAAEGTAVVSDQHHAVAADQPAVRLRSCRTCQQWRFQLRLNRNHIPGGAVVKRPLNTGAGHNAPSRGDDALT